MGKKSLYDMCMQKERGGKGPEEFREIEGLGNQRSPPMVKNYLMVSKNNGMI